MLGCLCICALTNPFYGNLELFKVQKHFWHKTTIATESKTLNTFLIPTPKNNFYLRAKKMWHQERMRLLCEKHYSQDVFLTNKKTYWQYYAQSSLYHSICWLATRFLTGKDHAEIYSESRERGNALWRDIQWP